VAAVTAWGLGLSTAGCAMEPGAADEAETAATSPQGVENPGPSAHATGAVVTSPVAQVRTPVAVHPVPLPDPAEVEPIRQVATVEQ
jgi:hypothetical protein